MISYEQADFRRCLRADRDTFNFLVTGLTPLMEKAHTFRGNTIQVDKRVAIGLWHYAHGGTILNTGEKFGVSAAAAHGILSEFIDAVIKVFEDKVTFLSGEALHQVMKGFESRRQFPNCVGAIDCSHILIYTPAIEHTKGYCDRNGKMSVVLQGVCDSQGRFLDINSGWPGSVNDKRVFLRSPLYTALKGRRVLKEPVVSINDMNVLPYLVGDAGYMLVMNVRAPPPVIFLSQRKRSCAGPSEPRACATVESGWSRAGSFTKS